MNRPAVILSDIWIKASIIGTTWAASEIVLGSFLHNLKIPFSGNILAGIGMILLISVSYVWKDKGLFWRAGLICALMKTLSPSAVIFGPMIAIFSQSVLLEASTRVFGRTVLGFVTGAMLAMSWNLFQKIINFIIFYGMNIVKVYESLVQSAQKQLHIEADVLWLPLILLLVVYCILGVIAAIIGMRTGKKIVSQPFEPLPVSPNSKLNTPLKNKPNTFRYSLIWLFMDILSIVGALLLIKNTLWFVWIPSILSLVVVWAIRYKRAIRQLMKPKFWIFFVLITMITAFVFTKIQGQELWEGLLIGLEMNFRALVIIVGFSVLGTELYNPKIQAFFLKTSFKQLPKALEMSFESLPLMIATLPDARSIIKDPVSIIHQVISQADSRLKEIKRQQDFSATVFILSGAIASSKTRTLGELIELLKGSAVKIGGFYSPRIMEHDITTGYDIISISSGKSAALLRLAEGDSNLKIGKYRLIPDGFSLGRELLKPENNNSNQLVVIDEIGKLELQGKGWAKSLEALLHSRKNHLLIAVRTDFVDAVIEKWHIKNYRVFDVDNLDSRKIAADILKTIKS